MDAKRYRRFGASSCPGRALGLVALLLAGCAGSPFSGSSPNPANGDTSQRPVAREGTQHYQLALGEISIGGTPVYRPAPAYPPELIPLRLPLQEVAARLMVNAEGKVDEVRMADDMQADPQRRLFAQAVRAAAMQWIFEPLRVNRWAADANGNSHEVDNEARPFSVDYMFRFAWKDGMPATDAGTPTNGAR